MQDDHFDTFLNDLEDRVGKKLKVRINDNRSTMLSVRWEPDQTRVSMHRMFLSAPRNVMEDLECYISGRNKVLAPTIKCYIEESLKRLDYSDRVDPSTLATRGRVYDLKGIYDDLNNRYFCDDLSVMITWFGNQRRRAKRHLTFGSYCELTKLIKVHRLLDCCDVPDYVVAFVVYHEMVHNVCPSEVEVSGLHRVHTKEFKERERCFSDYHAAKEWIKCHREGLFTGAIGF